MVYKEETQNILSVPDDYYLAQYISADFYMGKGLAVKFNKMFNIKNNLTEKYGDWLLMWDEFPDHRGVCLLDGRVLNLVVKRKYFSVPSIGTVKAALENMRTVAIHNHVSKIAITKLDPKDGIPWENISNVIKDVFSDLDIEIMVCNE